MSTQSKPKPFFNHTSKLYACIAWLLAAGFIFYQILILVSPDVLFPAMKASFQATSDQLMMISSCYFYAFLIFQIPAGIFVDKYGIRTPASIGIFICAIATLLFSLSESVYIAAISRFLMGIGASFAIVTLLKLSTQWFSTYYFGFLNGLGITFGMAAGLLGQAPLNIIFTSHNWRSTVFNLALAGFILAIVYWSVVRLPKKLKNNPGFRGAFIGLFKDPQNWLLFFYAGLTWTIIAGFAGFWGTPFLKEQFQLGDAPASVAISMIYIGFGVGAPFFGFLSDRCHMRKMILIFGTLATMIFFHVVAYLPQVPFGYLAFFLFLLGFSVSTHSLAFPMIFERNTPIISASLFAFLICGNSILGGLTDHLISIAISTEVNVKIALIRLPIYLIIALILLLFIKETHPKGKRERRK